MDIEAKRWRQLALLSEYHHPETRITFKKSTIKPKTVEKHSKTPSLRKNPNQRKAQFQTVLESLSQVQKQRIGDFLTGGRLDANQINNKLQHETAESRIIENDSVINKQETLKFEKTNVKESFTVPTYTKVSTTVLETAKTKSTRSEKLNKSISYPFYNKNSDKEKLEALETLHDYLKQEISQLNPVDENYEFKRIHVFSTCFNELISQFTTFKPILAAIKQEYDKIVMIKDDENIELVNLRSKVCELEAQNENRVMLDFEKKRRMVLEQEIKKQEQTRTELELEFRKRLGMYASYIPESLLKEHKMKHEDMTIDPIKGMQVRINELEVLLNQQTRENDNLYRIHQLDYVPKAVAEQLTLGLAEADAKLEVYNERNEELKRDLIEKNRKLEQLEEESNRVDHSYKVLQAEYSSLSETLANLLPH